MEIDNVVMRLAREVERRYYGKYRAFVVDNEDPEKLGRLKLRVPSVLGDAVVTGWAMPCLPYGGVANIGMLFIPKRDDGVWVEFEEGDLEFPIWVGTFWSKPSGESELPIPNNEDGEDEEVQSPPTCKIIKTEKGHTLQFEDADDKEMVLLKDGHNNHLIVFNKNGIKIIDATGNAIEMMEDAFNITSKVPFTIDASGQAITLKGSTIDLNKA